MNTFKILLALPVLLGAPVSQSVLSTLAIRDARAADNPTSPLTDIILPRGPVALRGDGTPFTKVLQDLAAIEVINLKPTGQQAEVWVWEGQWGGEDRGSYTQSAVQTALRAGGYTPHEIDSSETGAVNVFSAFDLEDKNLVFVPALTRRTDYFIATNDERRSTVVGMWLGGKNKLSLGLLPVEYKGKGKAKSNPRSASNANVSKPKSTPTGTNANVVVVKNIDDTMASLPRRPLPKFPPLARQPRMVRGWLKDAGGRPVANAEVAVYSSIGGGFRTTHKARSNAQGLYQVRVPAGVCEVAQVDTDVFYNGRKFNLHLEPVSGHAKQFRSQDGHVEHYVLRTTGTSGGTIRIVDGVKKGTIQVTLTPQGRLMDGSTIPTLIYRYPAGEEGVGREAYLNGIPLGRYKLTSQVLDDGETLPLRVRTASGGFEFHDSLTVDFESGFTYTQNNLNKSNMGVANFEVVINP